MIYAAPGATFTIRLNDAPTGLVGTLGVQVFDSEEVVVIARTTAGITEFPAGSGQYVTTLKAPSTAGAYIVFWDDGVISPGTVATEELVVTTSPPAAIAGSDLTDVASVRQLMQKTTSDKLQDPDIETLIHQASDAIQRHCNREFAPASSKVLRSFEFEPNTSLDLIDLKPYEYRALHTVTLDPDLEPVTLDATQFRTWPFPARDGTFFGLRLSDLPDPKLPSTTSTILPFGLRRLDVTADWGMLSVPSEVTHWTNVTVEAWLHLRREGGQPNETQVGEGPLPVGYDLPLPVKWGLRRWTRPTPEI
jgi:hypothetical protein